MQINLYNFIIFLNLFFIFGHSNCSKSHSFSLKDKQKAAKQHDQELSPREVITQWNANFAKNWSTLLHTLSNNKEPGKHVMHHLYTLKFNPKLYYDYTSSFPFPIKTVLRLTCFPKIAGYNTASKNCMMFAWDAQCGTCLQFRVSEWPHKTNQKVGLQQETLSDDEWPEVVQNPPYMNALLNQSQENECSISLFVQVPLYIQFLKNHEE